MFYESDFYKFTKIEKLAINIKKKCYLPLKCILKYNFYIFKNILFLFLDFLNNLPYLLLWKLCKDNNVTKIVSFEEIYIF